MATDQLAELIFSPTDSTASAESFKSITPTGSPLVFRATKRCGLHVVGGLITAVSYNRGGVTLGLGLTSGGEVFEMNAGDILTVAYTTIPTITMVPR